MENYNLSYIKIEKILSRNKKDFIKLKDNLKSISKSLKIKLVNVPDKSIPRIIEKIQRDNITINQFIKKNWSDKHFLFEVGDIIRYYIILENKEFCQNLVKILDNFNKNNITLVKCKSFLEPGDGYTGVNSIFFMKVNNKKIPFEIQFHTEKSKELKNSTILIKKKYKNDINNLYKNYNLFFKNNINLDSLKFIKYIKDNLNNEFKQHKIYRLIQIINLILINNTNKELKELRNDLFNKMIKYEKKSITKSFENCYNNKTLYPYCKNYIKKLD